MRDGALHAGVGADVQLKRNAMAELGTAWINVEKADAGERIERICGRLRQTCRVRRVGQLDDEMGDGTETVQTIRLSQQRFEDPLHVYPSRDIPHVPVGISGSTGS